MKHSIARIRLALSASAVVLAAATVQSCSWNSMRVETAKTVPREGTLAPVGGLEPRPANPPHKVFISPEAPLTPEAQLATFSLPPGFEIQLVASEPDIQKPMQLAFDERGRLLASCSRDYPLGPAEGQAPGDSLYLIEIDGETGAAGTITTFSSGYTICSGVEALPGGRVLLAHAPDILMLADTDGDGRADTSEVRYTGFARTDTHELPNSFAWGIDGWLYGLQGHVNESDVKNMAGEVTPIHHGNVFRMRPDGSKIEVWARGMSNPWGLAFDNQQELFGADCESRPIWQIVEGLPYQGFLQDDEPLGFAPFITEDPHGASGFAGLVSYTARAFPEPYRDCLYMGSPITGIIYRDRPEPAGSTLHLARRPDLLTSTDPWFRPVDVELGPDGALYIADWYNRIIAHVEVPLDHPDRDKERGRIWRIVYRGTGEAHADEDRDAIAAQFAGPMATDWSRVSRRELFAELSESNAWIRRQAAAQLIHRFPGELERPARRLLGRKNALEIARLEAFWLLQRQGLLAYDTMRALASDSSALIRRQAARALSLWDGEDSGERRTTLITLLCDPAPVVAREASMGLRHVPDATSLRALLNRQAVGDEPSTTGQTDTLLDYARGFAIREHLKDEPILEMLAGADGNTAADLVKFLAATHTPAAAALQADWLAAGRIPAEHHTMVLQNILARADAAIVRAVFHVDIPLAPAMGPPLAAYARAVFASGAPRRDVVDRGALYAAWYPHLEESANAGDRQIALEMAAGRKSADGLALARELLADSQAPERTRQTAAQLLLNLQYEASAGDVLRIVAEVEEPPGARRALAYELAARADTEARFGALLEALNGAPAPVQQGAVQSLARHQPSATYMLAAVERGDLNPALLNDTLTRIFIDDIHKDPQLTAWHRRLVERVEDAGSRANAQIARVRDRYDAYLMPDLVRGQVLLEQQCLVCHRIGGFGANRAPNLDGIGNRGIDRLLEDILQPSKEIDPAFRSTLITLKDGRTEEGFVAEEDDTWVILVDATGWQSEIRKADIAERARMWVSPMPPDFGTALPEGDLLDIIGFLMNPPETVQPLTETWKNTLP